MFIIFVHYPTRPICDVSMKLFCWPPSVDIFNILPGFLWQPLLKCKDWRRFSQVHPKPEFSEKVQRGDQGKFFKNRPKSSLCLKGPKALWRKLNYTQIKMQLKCKDWKRIWRKQRLQKCPNGQVTAIIARSPKTRIFWNSEKGKI